LATIQKPKKGEVQVDEAHAADEAGDRLREPLLGGRLFLFPLTAALQRPGCSAPAPG
jgi:hypothetical protein